MQNSRNGKIVAVLVVLSCFACMPSTPAFAGYFAVGAGYGGDGENASVSIETGQNGIDFSGFDMLFGLGLPIIPYGDNNLPSDTIDGNCPNDDCVRSSIEYSGTELGLYAKIGLKLFLDNLYLSVIGGGTVVTESEIVQSLATGRYYEASTDSVLSPMYGLGLGYFPDIYDWQLVIQIDVDNRRGVSGLLGWYW
jgi:hypothetical protein